jgi:hypothetical protein
MKSEGEELISKIFKMKKKKMTKKMMRKNFKKRMQKWKFKIMRK